MASRCEEPGQGRPPRARSRGRAGPPGVRSRGGAGPQARGAGAGWALRQEEQGQGGPPGVRSRAGWPPGVRSWVGVGPLRREEQGRRVARLEPGVGGTGRAGLWQVVVQVPRDATPGKPGGLAELSLNLGPESPCFIYAATNHRHHKQLLRSPLPRLEVPSEVVFEVYHGGHTSSGCRGTWRCGGRCGVSWASCMVFRPRNKHSAVP